MHPGACRTQGNFGLKSRKSSHSLEHSRKLKSDRLLENCQVYTALNLFMGDNDVWQVHLHSDPDLTDVLCNGFCKQSAQEKT